MKQRVELMLDDGPLLIEVALSEGEAERLPRDLARVWRQAEESGAVARDIEERGRAVGQGCRCALIAASLASVMEQIPPATLAELVARGAWTPAQALTCARRMPGERQRAGALTALVPHLPEALRDEVRVEALAVAQAMQEGELRMCTLADLAPCLPEPLKGEALGEALASVPAVQDVHTRDRARVTLAPRLAEAGYLTAALDVARAIKGDGYKAHALAGLAPYLAEPLLAEALDMARAIGRRHERAEVLAELADSLPEPQKTEVLAEALATVRGAPDAEALARLAPSLTESLMAEALAVARSLPEVYVDERDLAPGEEGVPESPQTQALLALAPHLPGPLQDEALRGAIKATQAMGDARALMDLASFLPDALGVEAWRAALAMARVDEYRVWQGLAPRLGGAGYALEVLEKAWAMTSPRERAKVLAALIPYLPEPPRDEVLREALAALEAFKLPWEHTKLLVELAAHLPQPLRNEALSVPLAAVRNIEDVGERARKLAGFVPLLSEPLADEMLREALAAAQASTNDWIRFLVLKRLAPRLVGSGGPDEALGAVLTIQDKKQRLEVLLDLSSHLPEPLRGEALQAGLEAAGAITEDWQKGPALAALIPRLAESGYLDEALTAMGALEGLWDRAAILARLAPDLPEPLHSEAIRQALAAAMATTNEAIRADVLARLAPHLARLGDTTQALAAARLVTKEEERLQVLAELAPYLTEASRSVGASASQAPQGGDAGPLSWPEPSGEETSQEVLATLPPIGDDDDREAALVGLADYLPEPLKEKTLAEARVLGAAGSQVERPADLASQMGEIETRLEWQPGWLMEKRQKLRSQLRRLVWQARLGASRRALASVQATKDPWERAQMLIALVSHLPASRLEEALAVAQAIKRQQWRVEALVEVALHTPEPRRSEILPEVMATVHEINDTRWQNREVGRLGLRLAKSGYLLEALALTRAIESDALRDMSLVVLVPRLGEAGHLDRALEAVRAIANGQRRGQALAGLAPYLTASLWSQTLHEALAIRGEDHRVWTLERLTAHLANLAPDTLYPIWCETLRALAARPRPCLLASLRVLAPAIVALGGQAALVETTEAIVEVGRWFP